VLVIDEAQNLDDAVLELVRMLSNFETASDKLIQIILAGQPQLADTIGSPQLLQLRQRISIFARLRPLTAEEISQYIASRLRIAGYASSMPLFTKDALTLIAFTSEGIPRNINNLCFNALSLGCALQQRPIDREVLRQVIADLDLGPLRKKTPLPPPVEEKTSPAAPAVSFTESDSSVFAGWLPKAAVGLVALLIAAAAFLGGRQWVNRPVTAQSAPASIEPAKAPSTETPSALPEPLSDAVVQPSSAGAAQPSSELADAAEPQAYPTRVAAPPAPAPSNSPVPHNAFRSERTPSASDPPGMVRVGPGQTLVGICVERFGNCTSQLLRQIRELNPSLNNLDHIETGQTIRIPVLDAQSNAGEQPHRTPAAEKGSHE
jgi:AAA domain